LSLTVFEKIPLDQLLSDAAPATASPAVPNQLTLFD